MNFKSFWTIACMGGTLPKGYSYSARNDQLVINLPANLKEETYPISKKTAEEYFNILKSSKMTGEEFRYNHSRYFLAVFNEIMNQ